MKVWAEGKLARMLLIDIKGTFDHVSRSCERHTMKGIGADGHLIR